MTHPTIKAAAKAFWKVPNLLDNDDDMIAAARVILSAPVSDAERKAMEDAFLEIIPVPSISMEAMTALLISVRNAGNSARRKELGVE